MDERNEGIKVIHGMSGRLSESKGTALQFVSAPLICVFQIADLPGCIALSKRQEIAQRYMQCPSLEWPQAFKNISKNLEWCLQKYPPYLYMYCIYVCVQGGCGGVKIKVVSVTLCFVRNN